MRLLDSWKHKDRAKAYKEQAEVRIGVKVGAQALYSEATYKRFAEDVVFFRKESARVGIDDLVKKRYSRMVVLLLPFYLESFSNAIFDKLATKPINKVDRVDDNGKKLPVPIQRLRAVHRELLGEQLALDIRGIRDLFTIRNKITAHPAGRADLKTTDSGWSRKDRLIGYLRFTDFPLVYSHFSFREADIALNEVEEFLTKFLNLLKGKVAEEQLREWWPTELAEREKRQDC